MQKKVLLLVTILLSLFVSIAIPCTMVMLNKNGQILAGNNEDWKNPNTFIWFYPATESEYGRVCVGFDEPFGEVQGGMNDQGLFIDGNALRETGWKEDPNKENTDKILFDYILAHCATVDEVIDYFNKYNDPELNSAKYPIADAQGNTLIVEWGQGKVQFIKNPDWYQISTNFVQSNFKPEEYPCHRYKIAEIILKDENKSSLEVVRKVLAATHAEYAYPTIYSNICDLVKKKIYLYNFHNFEEAVVFDLTEELKKEAHSYSIPSLFKVKTQAAAQFEKYTKQQEQEKK